MSGAHRILGNEGEGEGRSAFEESPECLILALVTPSGGAGVGGTFRMTYPWYWLGHAAGKGRPGLVGEVHSSSLLVCLLQATWGINPGNCPEGSWLKRDREDVSCDLSLLQICPGLQKPLSSLQ